MHSSTNRLAAASILRAAGEAVTFLLAIAAVWPFASAGPEETLVFSVGVAVLAFLWSAHALAVGEFRFRFDVVSVSLGGMICWAGFQLVPLPASVVRVIAPQRFEWNRTLVPQRLEQLPGELQASELSRSIPLSVAPAATRRFIGDLLAILILYAAVRNFVASRAAFVRFAWLAAANAVVLAAFSLGQSFTAPPNTIYGWPMEGAGCFGPFICRNHYPDFAAFCIGLTLGLIVRPPTRTVVDDSPATTWDRIRDGLLAPFAVFNSPRGVGLALAAALVLVSVPFSLSRGGTISILIAGLLAALLLRPLSGRSVRTRAALLGGLTAVGFFAIWLGWDRVEDRMGTLTKKDAGLSRLPLWKDSVNAIPGAWLTGTGSGAFEWIEPTVHTHGGPTVHLAYEHAHNEYLEALVEGGLVRLALLLSLAVGTLVVVGRGAVRRRERSVGPLLAGSWFGLAALAIHSIFDFGIWVPAVAGMAAVVAGFAVAGATDPEFIQEKVRVRVRRRKSDETVAPPAASEPESPRPRAATGTLAVCLGLSVVMAAGIVVLEARARAIASRLKRDAEAIAVDFDRAAPQADRVAYLAARVRVRPSDGVALADYASASVDAAVEATAITGAAVAGAGAAAANPVDRFPPAISDRFLIPALAAARDARSANPLLPDPHRIFGLYGSAAVAAEPAGVHLERAKRLRSTDPAVWFRAGQAAYDDGDNAEAWSNWREAVARSPDFLRFILPQAARRLGPAGLVAELLPADASLLVAAANDRYPDPVVDERLRRPLLAAAVEAATRADSSVVELTAGASAAEELGRSDSAASLWKRAAEKAPNDAAVRAGYARFLEREERYADAVVQLKWLSSRRPDDPGLKDRLEAATHGAHLAEVLAK